MLWVLGLVAILDALQKFWAIQFIKDIRFDRDCLLRVGSGLGSFIVAVPLASVWRSYWALIARMIVGRVSRLVRRYAIHSYRPGAAMPPPQP